MKQDRDIYSGDLSSVFSNAFQMAIKTRRAQNSLLSSFNNKSILEEDNTHQSINGFLEDLCKWVNIVDETIIKHTVAVWRKEKDSFRTLWVYIDSSLLASQCQMSRNLYLAHIQMVYKDEWVDDIQFKYSPYQSQNKTQTSIKRRKPQSLDTIELTQDELQEIYNACSIIENEKVAQSAQEAMIAYYKRQKIN